MKIEIKMQVGFKQTARTTFRLTAAEWEDERSGL
jgi:hypothetical protein